MTDQAPAEITGMKTQTDQIKNSEIINEVAKIRGLGVLNERVAIVTEIAILKDPEQRKQTGKTLQIRS